MSHASSASVFSPFNAANATFALNAGVWFRLVMVSPDLRYPHRIQAEIPLSRLSRFFRPPLRRPHAADLGLGKGLLDEIACNMTHGS